MGRQARRVVQRAEQTLELQVRALPALHLEGVLFSDPRYKESQEALRPLDDLYTWAVCARVADQPLADQCTQKAISTVNTWVHTYKPTGNPIDESRFVPLLQAMDLLLPTLEAEKQAPWLTWVAELARRGDRFYAGLGPTDLRRVNNWASWRLLLRAMSATITADPVMLSSTRKLVGAHVAQNLHEDGSSLDFHHRDALLYHVYNLEALVELLLFVPGVIDAEDESAIARALDFLKPYFTGDKTHLEFPNSPVQFDTQRREAGDPSYANTPWDPKGARGLLRLARAYFLAIRPWTQTVVDEQYSPRWKHLAAVQGGP